METSIKEVRELLSHSKSTAIDLSIKLAAILSNQSPQEQFNTFKYLCDNFFDIDSDETRKIRVKYSQDNKKQILSIYGETIKNSINSILCKMYLKEIDNEGCYELLRELVFDNPLLTNELQRGLALFFVLKNVEFPIENDETQVLNISNSKFKKISDSNQKTINEVIQILDLPFPQKTQTTSLILSKILKLKTLDDMSVALAITLSYFRRKIINEFKECKEYDF